MSTSQPAPYSSSDTAEVESTATFLGLIDLSRIKADIKERDKFPNIDGYLEIVSEQNYSIGKLEIQIKKLNEGYVDRPRYNLDTSFFGYVLKVACYPTIIISVDTARAHKIHLFLRNNEEVYSGLLSDFVEWIDEEGDRNQKVEESTKILFLAISRKLLKLFTEHVYNESSIVGIPARATDNLTLVLIKINICSLLKNITNIGARAKKFRRMTPQFSCPCRARTFVSLRYFFSQVVDTNVL